MVNHRVVRCGFLLVAVLVLGGLVGCSGTKGPSPAKLSELRATPSSRETIERSVPRAAFVAAVDRVKGSDRLRLVPVFRREGAGRATTPEYRLFDVGRDSPYALLGLATADVLLAVDDYVVYQPEGFRSYVSLLGGSASVSLEVVRDGRPLLIRTVFVDNQG